MDLTHRHWHHVDLLSIGGHVRAPEAIKLRERINQLFDDGRFCVVLDLAHLESIGSSGLYVLVEARNRAQAQRVTGWDRGGVRLVHLPPRIKEIFDLTGFTPLFHLYEDLGDAVNSFSGPTAPNVRNDERIARLWPRPNGKQLIQE